ncbi:MAG: AAA family ATPase, partial [Kiritimatiellae bacterium]|nr:AAA family ATPase [Kiritimatiellia bacterium]
MVKGTNKDEKRVCIGRTVRRDELLPPPVGTSDWATFSRDSYCVDKTLILKDLIDSRSREVLFTRPRRFGKTTTLKMIC